MKCLHHYSVADVRPEACSKFKIFSLHRHQFFSLQFIDTVTAKSAVYFMSGYAYAGLASQNRGLHCFTRNTRSNVILQSFNHELSWQLKGMKKKDQIYLVRIYINFNIILFSDLYIQNNKLFDVKKICVWWCNITVVFYENPIAIIVLIIQIWGRLFTCNCDYIKAVSYTHLDVYKRQVNYKLFYYNN